MPDDPINDAPLGATIAGGGVDFRVWAPDATRIDVEVRGMAPVRMMRGDGDVWHARVGGIGAAARYIFRLDDRWSYPDPYARSQPDGVYDASEVIDPGAFVWSDAGWGGLHDRGLAIYEMHIGTFTPDGTFDAAVKQLDALAQLGVTAVELMPVSEFPGERNWGYDGVGLFAPSHVYGGPEALKRFVDAAHARGIGVILDCVYNHFGPDGAYFTQFARDYLTDRHETPWGDAINYDGANSHMVRRLVLDNARYWVREYHIDGIRIDAAFTFKDDSPRHILAELADAAREAAAPRSIVMIAETYENDVRYLRPESAGGLGFDAVWADDFHHTVHARATHERGGYYADYEGSMQELARTIERGWLYEGQMSRHFGAARGTSSRDVPAPALIYALENHDQVANHAFGQRLSDGMTPSLYRAWSALLLLLPYTPMIFMGQEFMATTPFRYFTDHHGNLGRAVTEGRFAQFARYESDDERRRRFPDPQDEATFLASKLDREESEREPGRGVLTLYGELLRLRREDPVLAPQDRFAMTVRAVDDDALVVEMAHEGAKRMLVLNTDGAREIALDAGAGREWSVLMSTEELRFGGDGSVPRLEGGALSMPAASAAWLAAE
jgi:maltooligosyltrehalose trehalohydrolase